MPQAQRMAFPLQHTCVIHVGGVPGPGLLAAGRANPGIHAAHSLCCEVALKRYARSQCSMGTVLCGRAFCLRLWALAV